VDVWTDICDGKHVSTFVFAMYTISEIYPTFVPWKESLTRL
jgi:hypothetical protein